MPNTILEKKQLVPGQTSKLVIHAPDIAARAQPGNFVIGRAYDFPHFDTPIIRGRNVTVYGGGGNVAMDAARTARRLGAESVRIVYRRTVEAMPARREEVEHAIEEGVIMECLAAPLEFLPGQDGNLGTVRLQRMELGEPDASGRRSPRPVPDDVYELDTDLAVIAVAPVRTSCCWRTSRALP